MSIPGSRFIFSLFARLAHPGISQTPRSFEEMSTMHPKAQRRRQASRPLEPKKSVWR